MGKKSIPNPVITASILSNIDFPISLSFKETLINQGFLQHRDVLPFSIAVSD